MPHQCPLCFNERTSLKFKKNTAQDYWDCHNCGLIFLNPSFHPSQSKEKAHYLNHTNDVDDPSYQHFVSPIVNYVLKNVPAGTHGLDFGAGPGPVITALLKSRYQMKMYDPFFWEDQSALAKEYDFIIACEVIEHFHSPASEFHKLRSLLKTPGHLAMMTHLYADSISFNSWYYQLDPTHVVFYRIETIEWIKQHHGFKYLHINGRALFLELCCCHRRSATL